MWEPIWASRFRYWLLTGDVSRSCLHSSRTRRVRTLNVSMTVILWVYVFWCTEGSSESRVWSWTWRGVLKWSRHKDRYIGSLYLDIGIVPGEIGILPEYRGVVNMGIQVPGRICRSQYGHPASAIGYWPERCLSHVYIVLEPVGSARLTFHDDLYYELCVLVTGVCSESRMRSRTWRGVSKWSRGKDSYIGR